AFNGYKRVAIGENQTVVANLRLKDTAIDIVRRTQEAYWDLVLNRERLIVRENSLELARELLEINREKEKAGFISRLDVLSTEANIAAKEEGLLQGQRALAQSEDALKKLLNPDSTFVSWNTVI